MIAKNGLCVYIQGMNMLKKFNNCAQFCASLIIGFTPGAFAADPNAILMNIPPPPSLQNPISESRPAAAYGSANNRSATVGTNKKASPSSSDLAAAVPKLPNANASSFANKGKGGDTNRAAFNQNANANAVNAATREAAKKAALNSPALATTTWSFQQMPAANTMYTMPLSK